MSASRRLRTLGLVVSAAAVAGAGTVAAGAATSGSDDPGAQAAATPRITARGVGAVRVGATFPALRAAGLVGPKIPGCELSGPGARATKLRAPLKGTVDLDRRSPRRARSITITGGAKARGVGIGATAAQIKKAFPKARVDRSLEDTFAMTFVRVPRGGGGRIVFGLPTNTKKVTLIGVPFIALCE